MTPQELASALALPSIEHKTNTTSIGRPWYISLLLNASGWIAGLFLLFFVGILFRPETPEGFFFSGLFCLSAAFGLFALDKRGDFVAQLGLALSVAGQILMVAAMWGGKFGSTLSLWLIFFMQTGLVIIMPSTLHRGLSAFFACIALSMAMRLSLFGQESTNNFGFNTFAQTVPPTLGHAILTWAATWLPIAALIWSLIRTEAHWMAHKRQALVRPALSGLIVGLAFATMASHPFELFDMRRQHFEDTGYLALWPLLSALLAAAAIAAGFALRSRALMGIAFIGALIHVSHFYYALGTSLLSKSLLMVAMGAIFIGAAIALNRVDKDQGAAT
jgi:Domain of unknown function (DUF4401)